MHRFVAAAALLGLSGLAQADTITGSYTTSYREGVSFVRNGHADSVSTVRFNWTRSDVPGSPGVNSSVPVSFHTYCAEVDFTFTGNGPHEYEVVSLSDYGIGHGEAQLLRRLWGNYFGTIDTDTESAAFQSMVWELLYDTDHSMTTGNFKLTGGASALAQASAYMNTVSNTNYAGPKARLVVLVGDEQDQITMVPAPGALGVAGLALLAAGRRRR